MLVTYFAEHTDYVDLWVSPGNTREKPTGLNFSKSSPGRNPQVFPKKPTGLNFSKFSPGRNPQVFPEEPTGLNFSKTKHRAPRERRSCPFARPSSVTRTVAPEMTEIEHCPVQL